MEERQHPKRKGLMKDSSSLEDAPYIPSKVYKEKSTLDT